MRWSNVVPSGLVWEKKFSADIWSLKSWAAFVTCDSSVSGSQPAFARSSLTSVMTWAATEGATRAAGLVLGGGAGSDVDGCGCVDVSVGVGSALDVVGAGAEVVGAGG